MRITMGWDAATRRHYGVRLSKRANCLRDDEWSMISPFMPHRQARGRPRATSLRTVVDAILYIAWTGCQWRALPSCFPPVSTVQRYFYRWRDDGTLRTINLHLVMVAREAKGRGASPSAGVIDSQSAKTTDVAGPRGFDAGKKVMGRKRHILTDTEGHLLAAQVHTADIQDRDGAAPLLTSVRGLLPWLRHIFADGGYAGPKLEAELAGNGCWDLEIVRRSDAAKGFVLLPRRWVVERTFALLGRCRRLAKDFEACIASAEAWIFVAAIPILLRRSPASQQITPEL
jgi:transposase